MANLPQSKSSVTTVLVALAIVACLMAVSWNGLRNPELEGLDGAHHVMDGVFFHDLLTDLPFSRLTSYPFDYYKQYPALGFIFWPPLFPFVEGLVFKVAGISLFTAQLSVLLFAGLLAFCMYRLGRHYLPPYPALAATLLLLTAQGLYQYFNVVMREIPMLAMMALTALLYLNIVQPGARKAGALQWQALALVAAMSLYTKQTAFILFPAIAADLLLNHRHLLRTRQPWLALLSAALLTLPLALFTLKFGKANIEQSVGQNTQLIMSGYEGLARWSFANWTYYPGVLPQMLNWGVLALAMAEVLLSLFSRSRLKRNCLWLAWLVSFYLLFSYFDNKSDRFAVLAIPPLCVLALLFLWDRLTDQPAIAHWMRHGLVIATLASSAWILTQQPLHRLQGIHAIMDEFDVSSMDGNIAYMGKYRQAFVYDIRLQDRERSHHVLQGGDLLADVATLEQHLRNYRIRYLFLEPENLGDHEQQIVAALMARADITPVLSSVFRDRSRNYQLVVLRNEGVLAPTMAPFSLSSSLID